MKSFVILFLFCNIAYSQDNYHAMDTTIHKDEYYEMAYQLNELRDKTDSLEFELRIMEWKFKGYQYLVDVYEKELRLFDKKRKRRKYYEKNISKN